MTDAGKAQSTARSEGVGSHTPTPWYPNTSHGPKTYVWADVDDEPVLVAVCRSRDAMIPNPSGAPAREAEGNVAFIVRACNSHSELVDALEACSDHIASSSDLMGDDPMVKQARAALARARGETTDE